MGGLSPEEAIIIWVKKPINLIDLLLWMMTEIEMAVLRLAFREMARREMGLVSNPG